jgi:hypothetical protein
MCKIYLITLLFELFFIIELTASGSVCKNDQKRTIQNQTAYNIENCANTEIDLGMESARASLIHVEAMNNQISKISNDTFKSAKQLIHIDLENNRIGQISVGAFKDQGKLKHLYLEHNKLTRIEVGTFDSLVELKELWLQENQILMIERGLFDQNPNMETLYFHKNKIFAIESKVFEKLNAIKSLFLKDNICINQNYNSNYFNQHFNCFKIFEILFRPTLDKADKCKKKKTACLSEKIFLNESLTVNKMSLSDCQLDNTTIHIERDQLSEQLQICESQISPQKTDSVMLGLYILLAVTALQFSIIIILLWKLKSKNGVESSQGEPEIAVEGNPNENNLIYAALDLKPSNRTPIKSPDEVIYSEVQNLERPSESTLAVPRNHKK